MPNQSKQTPTIDPYRILQQAHKFFVAQETLYEKVTAVPPSADDLVIPALVLSAFASELFLKGLIAIETGKAPPQGHDLYLLFKKLSAPTRHRLEEMWNWYAHGRKAAWDGLEKERGNPVPRDLPRCLRMATGAFQGMRYHYEPSAINYQFILDDLPHVLGLMAMELKPESAGKPPDWKSDADFSIPSRPSG
jgi:hypothetical protein